MRGLVRRRADSNVGQNTGELLPADVAGIGMRHDYPSPGDSLNLTYFRDRRQILSKARPWRSRERRYRGLGMLVQIDGSHHRWLDEQGPQFTLLLAVDGTTSAVVNAVFRPEEDTRGYFVLMQGLIQRGGVPLARYGDRHGVFKFSGKPKHI